MESVLNAPGSGEEHHAAADQRVDQPSKLVHVDLWVRDPDLVDALCMHESGRPRDDYAKSALRIGIVALQQAQGRIDAETVRNEGTRLLEALEARLNSYQGNVGSVLSTTLREYFDPSSGRFTERVERLIRQDGDLERVMRGQIDATAAALAKALDQSVGENSAFAKLLTPNDSNALVSTIRSSVDGLVNTQRDRILGEFSLDNKSGALARLLDEINVSNGKLSDGLRDTVGKVFDEFSLDNDDSALSRLVKRVEAAQSQMNAEFTLDTEDSALFRMRRDLLTVIDSLRKDSDEFHTSVREALAAMQTRQDEPRSPRDGRVFEQAAFDLIANACQQAGDIPEQTGNKTGYIKNRKVGDCVITLGPECEAAGSKIVCEMKEDASYDLAAGLAEIATARANRGAEVGLFIFSSQTAPSGLRPFGRYGIDVVVVWDAMNEATDVFLSAGLMVAKALAVRSKVVEEGLAADFEAVDRSIREIERQAGYLEEIKTSSATIKSGAEKILHRVELMRAALEKQVGLLDTQVDLLRKITGAQGQ
jgi:hypothetical protein